MKHTNIALLAAAASVEAAAELKGLTRHPLRQRLQHNVTAYRGMREMPSAQDCRHRVMQDTA